MNTTKTIETSNPLWVFLLALLASSVNLQAVSTVQFTATAINVAEYAGTVVIAIQRTSDLNTPISVDYACADGKAANGLNYTAVSGTLAFGSGETNRTILVPILNEGLLEGTKSFRVGLSNPSAGAVLGSRTIATVFISDNDAGVQFVWTAYSVAENAGTVQLAVMRGDDGLLPVSVDIITADLTGTNGEDYVGITNTLSFGAREYFKGIALPILDNSLKQSSRMFRVSLANPVGLMLGTQKAATVTIMDNELGFQFESATYTVAEDTGVVRLNVLRGTDDTNHASTVDYSAIDVTATNGLDYAAASGTLLFAPGDRARTICIGILNNAVKDGARTFRVALSNPSGGAELGSVITTTVSILDNDAGLGFEQTSYANAWGEGTITVPVLRGNDWSLGPISVDYTTSDGSARADIDYEAASGTLRFGPNETVKALTISLLQNRAPEGAKNFLLTLSNPTGGAILGRITTKLNIVGAYATLAPSFDPGLAVARDGGIITLTWRGGGTLQRADTATGPWQTLTSSRSPCTIQSSVPTTFYRVAHPRPFNLYIPTNYSDHTPMPLVISISPTSGAEFENGVRFRPLAESRGFLYCYPERNQYQYWNAFFWDPREASVLRYGYADDSAYLLGIIQEVAKRFALDPKRIYAVGISGGADMAYRLARDSADLIAGITSIAGSVMLLGGERTPSQPVNILEIHGTADSAMLYDDFVWPGPPFWLIPGALHTIQIWAGWNGARDLVTEPAATLDLDSSLPGLDTAITRYTDHPPGGAVELWTIKGAEHVPVISSEFSPRVIDWLLAHPKP